MAGPTPKTWKTQVVADGEELLLELPEDLLYEMNWSIGDTLVWEELEEGCWSLRKRESLLTRILRSIKLYK